MHRPPIFLTPHRRARLIALLRLALMWAAAVLFGALAPNRRHIKQRYDWLGLDGLARTVCGLAIIRATELARLPLEPRRPNARASAPSGFRRRVAASGMNRAMMGAHLRRWFSTKDAGQCIQRLLDALADLDAFVRKHVLKRAKRRLTKLRPLVAVRPPVQGFVSACAAAPQLADSS